MILMVEGMNVELPEDPDELTNRQLIKDLVDNNAAKNLRRELNAVMGIDAETELNGNGKMACSDVYRFNKEQLATLIVATGGPLK